VNWRKISNILWCWFPEEIDVLMWISHSIEVRYNTCSIEKDCICNFHFTNWCTIFQIESSCLILKDVYIRRHSVVTSNNWLLLKKISDCSRSILLDCKNKGTAIKVQLSCTPRLASFVSTCLKWASLTDLTCLDLIHILNSLVNWTLT
jgi:hypothetical protein